MRYDIPGQETLEIDTLILDLNETLSVGGEVPTQLQPTLALNGDRLVATLRP